MNKKNNNIINLIRKKPFIVAEIGQAHEGSIGIAHSLIDAIAETGADAVKFQCHLSDYESSKFDKFRVNIDYLEDNSRYDYWKRMEFNIGQWKGLKLHAEKKGLFFLCSPFSKKAVDLLKKIKVMAWKIGSGEVSNYELIEYISQNNQPIILSSGLISEKELSLSIDTIKKYHEKIALLYCVSKYPSELKDINLNLIKNYQNKYNFPIGYSDHSGSIYPPIAAISLGAKIVEVHVTFDRKMFGFDSASSLNINELSELVKARNMITQTLSYNNTNLNNHINKMKKLFGKSIFLQKNLKKDEIIKSEHLILKKPGIGIKQENKHKILGKKAKVNLKKDTLLKLKDFY